MGKLDEAEVLPHDHWVPSRTVNQPQGPGVCNHTLITRRAHADNGLCL